MTEINRLNGNAALAGRIVAKWPAVRYHLCDAARRQAIRHSAAEPNGSVSFQVVASVDSGLRRNDGKKLNHLTGNAAEPNQFIDVANGGY